MGKIPSPKSLLEVLKNERVFEVLIIDDNPAELKLLTQAWADCGIPNRLSALRDHREMANYMHRAGEYEHAVLPDLIMLDYKMPVDGGAALTMVKGDPDYLHVPVVVFTGSNSPDDIMEIYRRHANCCHHKPFELEEYFQIVKEIAEHWFVKTVLPPRRDGAQAQDGPSTSPEIHK